MNPIDQIAQELHLQSTQVKNTIALLEAGNTLPFIARYRKEATENLDETQIGGVYDRWHYLKALDERRQVILQSLQSQNKLTPELQQKIAQATAKQQLEDLYLPFKPKRRTRAMIAKEQGFEPLALLILNPATRHHELEDWIEQYNQKTPETLTPAQAYDFATDIIAETISEQAETREKVRAFFFKHGAFVSKVKPDYAEQSSKFETYYDFREAVCSIPAHRYLALRRGEKENILKLIIEVSEDEMLQHLRPLWIAPHNTETAAILEQALQDAFRRLLAPSIETEIRLESRLKADEASIEIFTKNLRQLLLEPPGGPRFVLGLDPGFRTGTKWALVDTTGKFLDHGIIFPVPPQNKIAAAEQILAQLCAQHPLEIIALGNGTASREVQRFVQSFLKARNLAIDCVVVSESGASVYSASEAARKEFPDLDLTVRGAISIARRYQDPLAELVKIDPKSLGVGQYQHDVNQNRLQQALVRTVESCVNHVGVDLNTASSQLLTYVAGITASIADNILEHRNTHGSFQSRKELQKVAGVGPKTFEQAAGFLRIQNGSNPLDNSAVHPENYPLVEKIAQDQGIPIASLLGNAPQIEQISLTQYLNAHIGEYTLQDILAELRKPGRDPRATHQITQFDESIESLEQLKPGMKLPGIVTNITNFGAFVDIGLHQNGLVHISAMSTKFVKNPLEVCAMGQRVEVYVLAVDARRERIALSLVDPQKKEQKRKPKRSSRF